MVDNREQSLSERFRQLDHRKKAAARAYKESEKQKQAENNVFVRINAIRNGVALEDGATDQELELLASVDGDLSKLTLDENGHLCRVSDIEPAENGKTGGKAEVHVPSSVNAANRALEAEMERRKAAYNKSHGTESAPDGPTGEFVNGGVYDLPLANEPEIDMSVPLAENIKVLRVEDLAYTEARIYISFAENEQTGERAFGMYVEFGYGKGRTAYTQGERRYDKSLTDMAYRAATNALALFTQPGQPIQDVTIFMPKDIGWELMQNSWNLTTGAYDASADAYSQTFRVCEGQKVKIRYAPAEAKSHEQELAKNIAAQLVKVPV